MADLLLIGCVDSLKVSMDMSNAQAVFELNGQAISLNSKQVQMLRKILATCACEQNLKAEAEFQAKYSRDLF